MGYNTNYKITASGFTDKNEIEFFLFQFGIVTEDEFDAEMYSPDHEIEENVLKLDLDYCRWYYFMEDCLNMSKMFPNVLIEVYGEGEEPGDIWKCRFKNFIYERIPAEIVFADFKNITD